MEMTSCALCARPRTAADIRGLAWSSQHSRTGVVSWLCPGCTRDRLFEIEASLPLQTAANALRPAA